MGPNKCSKPIWRPYLPDPNPSEKPGERKGSPGEISKTYQVQPPQPSFGLEIGHVTAHPFLVPAAPLPIGYQRYLPYFLPAGACFPPLALPTPAKPLPAVKRPSTFTKPSPKEVKSVSPGCRYYGCVQCENLNPLHQPQPGCMCPICGKVFSRHWLLQGHLRTHTGEKPFKCPVCSKAFADKSNMRAHVQTHSGVKPWKCHRCGKNFALKSYLSKHQESACVHYVL